jgi:hypothetical protein
MSSVRCARPVIRDSHFVRIEKREGTIDKPPLFEFEAAKCQAVKAHINGKGLLSLLCSAKRSKSPLSQPLSV